jgi:RNA polymerase sigma-70 factor (ECF subfamily)
LFQTKHATFQAIVQAHSAELYRYAYWLCRDRCAAEDLVQETFARAWNAWGSLRDSGAAKGWLYTIARREHARLYERKRLDTADEQDLDGFLDQRVPSASAEIEMREALHALPIAYREPLLLQVLGGFSCEEIARMMELSVGAVMTRLSRARMMLRNDAAHARQGGRSQAAR